jgi:hypothetical protein
MFVELMREEMAAPKPVGGFRAEGWNIGAPQAKFSSNPDENFAEFGVG